MWWILSSIATRPGTATRYKRHTRDKNPCTISQRDIDNSCVQLELAIDRQNIASIMATQLDPEFPCSLYGPFSSRIGPQLTKHSSTIDLPLPTARLASAALQALRVDKELSPLVCRSFSTISPSQSEEETVLRTEYKATTNRMLRVAVNGFMESLSVVLGVMEELDVDVLGVGLEKEG